MRTFKTKADLQEAIKEQITSSDNSAIRAMLRIYEYQTADEKQEGVTAYHNGVGFTSNDADILTSFSKQVLSHRILSQKQVAVVRKLIGKYSAQLLRHAIERGLYKKIDGVWMVV